MPNPLELGELAEGAVSLLESGRSGSLAEEVTTIMTGGAKGEVVGQNFAIKGGISSIGRSKLLDLNRFPLVRIDATTNVLPGVGLTFRSLTPEVEGAVTKALDLPEGVRFSRSDIWSAAVKPPENFPVPRDISVLRLENPGFVKGYEQYGLLRQLMVDLSRGMERTVTAENGTEGLLLNDMQANMVPAARVFGEHVPNQIVNSQPMLRMFGGGFHQELHFPKPFELFSAAGKPVEVTTITSEMLEGARKSTTVFTSSLGKNLRNLSQRAAA